MIEVRISYPTPEGSQSLVLKDSDKLTIGRSSQADLRLNEDSISRLHATIYREGEKIWINDENSTNGTFVNGMKVPPEGFPLRNGDRIRLGNYPEIVLQISERNEKIASKSQENLTSSAAPDKPTILPILIIASSVFIFFFALAFVIINALSSSEDGNKNRRVFVENRAESQNTKRKSTDAEENKVTTNNTNENSAETLKVTETPSQPTRPKKKFFEMTEAEKDEYVKEKAEKISRIIGNQASEPIPPEAIRSIRTHLQGYINRIRKERTDNCQQGAFTKSDTITILQRASRNAPFIIGSFYSEGLDPQIGLYIAMIESEHCPCLQSPTGALGIFQFVRSTGREFGLQIKQDASPTNPDERCDPEKAAKAAARYIKSLISRFGSGPISFPLAIASYNSGQGGLSANLEKALKTAANQERSFWTLVANQTIFEGKVGEQFRKENVKYVPKFFAAAIIGENPQDFGIEMASLSTYTK